MKRALMGTALAVVIAIAGCGGQPSGSLEITENGTYDVSQYSQVVVNVGGEEVEEVAAEPEIPTSLDLVRVQFKGFSMEVPADMVEGYTEAELTENSTLSFNSRDAENTGYAMLYINMLDLGGGSTLESFSDAPQEDVNGIAMAVRHSHGGDSREIKVNYVYENTLYSVYLNHSISWDELYADYSEQFYRTIQMG